MTGLLNLPKIFNDGPNGMASTVALSAVKLIFDFALKSEASSRPHILELLSSLDPSHSPPVSANGKPMPRSVLFKDTPLTSLFTDGMSEDLIWEQLDLRAQAVCAVLDHVLADDPDGSDDDPMEDGSLDEELNSDDNLVYGYGIDSEDTDTENHDDSSAADLGESVTGLRDSSSDGTDTDQDGVSPSKLAQKRDSELNDDFFNLLSFNAEIEAAEAKSASVGRLGADDLDSDDDVPVDLFAPVDGYELDENDSTNDTGEVYYQDFFEPPRSKPRHPVPKAAGSTTRVRFHDEVRVKHIKAKGRRLPVSALTLFRNLGRLGGKFQNDGEEGELEDDNDDPMDEDSEHDEDTGDSNLRTIERLKTDLFADDTDQKDENLSAHESRMDDLRRQIAELEAENVRKKDWVLMGEANARSRPQNSLLEVDLEFERAMKAVPVMTEETVRDLEERIKARILEGRFDDVIRRRPMDDKPFLPSRFFELKDTKSTQSLAQIYEAEYMAAQTGDVVGEDRDGRLKKEHDEIEKLWENICGKLDALCNAHFVPKQPKATISTVSNVPSATLESALPTTKSVSTMLAPEEVFAPTPSDLQARSELMPAEKRALRSKQRKLRKKMRDTLDKSVEKYAKKSLRSVKKQGDLKSTVKAGKGVTVVGKKVKDRPRTRVAES